MNSRTLQIGIPILAALLFLILGVLNFQGIQEYSTTNVSSETLMLEESTEEESAEKVSLSYETRLRKGDQLFEAGSYEAAASEYALATKIEPEEAEAHRKLGKSYLKLGDYERAVFEFEIALSQSPSDDARADYAHALLQSKNFERAQEMLSQVSESHQAGRFYLGLLQTFQGNYEEAEQNFQKAAELRGSILFSTIQNFQNAFTSYESQQEGDSIYLKAMLAKAYIDAEEYTLAEELAKTILNEKNDYRDVWILLGYAQLKLENFREAEESFKAAKSLDAVKAETHYFLGLAHYEQKEYAEAIDSFELALLYGFEPESEAYLKLAESQTFLGNYEDALAAYEILIKIEASELERFTEAIRIAMDLMSDLDRALTLATEATSYFPNEAASHLLLAQVYFKRGKLELAQESLNTTLQINPDFPEGHYLAGELYLAQKNLEQAKTSFKKAYELSKPGDSLSIKAAEQYNSLALSPN